MIKEALETLGKFKVAAPSPAGGAATVAPGKPWTQQAQESIAPLSAGRQPGWLEKLRGSAGTMGIPATGAPGKPWGAQAQESVAALSAGRKPGWLENLRGEVSNIQGVGTMRPSSPSGTQGTPPPAQGATPKPPYGDYSGLTKGLAHAYSGAKALFSKGLKPGAPAGGAATTPAGPAKPFRSPVDVVADWAKANPAQGEKARAALMTSPARAEYERLGLGKTLAGSKTTFGGMTGPEREKYYGRQFAKIEGMGEEGKGHWRAERLAKLIKQDQARQGWQGALAAGNKDEAARQHKLYSGLTAGGAPRKAVAKVVAKPIPKLVPFVSSGGRAGIAAGDIPQSGSLGGWGSEGARGGRPAGRQLALGKMPTISPASAKRQFSDLGLAARMARKGTENIEPGNPGRGQIIDPTRYTTSPRAVASRGGRFPTVPKSQGGGVLSGPVPNTQVTAKETAPAQNVKPTPTQIPMSPRLLPSPTLSVPKFKPLSVPAK